MIEYWLIGGVILFYGVIIYAFRCAVKWNRAVKDLDKTLIYLDSIFHFKEHDWQIVGKTIKREW